MGEGRGGWVMKGSRVSDVPMCLYTKMLHLWVFWLDSKSFFKYIFKNKKGKYFEKVENNTRTGSGKWAETIV